MHSDQLKNEQILKNNEKNIKKKLYSMLQENNKYATGRYYGTASGCKWSPN